MIVNARISGTQIGSERGKRFLVVGFAYGGDQYGGSLRIDEPDLDATVWPILAAIGRQCWDELKSAPVRVKMDDSRKVVAIGHYLEDTWFQLERDDDD